MARKSRRGASSAPKNKSFIHKGPEAYDRVDDELEKQAQRRAASGSGNIFNFFMKPGDTKEYAVLDEEPICFIYEHTLKDPRTGKYSIVKTCATDHDVCPACEEVGPSTYVMKLSILDFTAYEDSKGNTHEYSRKLMTVKPSQQKKFLRRLAKDGSLRGAVFEASRDGPKDAAIGNDIEFLEFMDEDELANDYISTWEDKDGKTHTDNLGEPFVYEGIIAPPDVKELRALVGGSPAPGSQDHNKETMDEDGWDDDKDDEEPWDKDDDDNEGNAKQDEEESSRRSSGRARRGSSRRSSSRKSADKEDDNASRDRGSRRSRRARR